MMAIFCAVPYDGFGQREKKRKSTSALSEGRLREAEFYFTEAEKYFILEDYAKALLYFQRVAELNPDNPTVHYKMAEVLSKGNKEEDLVRAAASIDYALKLDPGNKYFYLLASHIYASLTNFTKAAHLLETMLREIPGTEEYLYELAAMYQYNNKPEEAIKVYDRAETIFGVNEMASSQKERLYLQLGKTGDAIREAKKLVDTFPDEEQYIADYAELLSRHEQVNEAIQILEDYIRRNPGAGPTTILLAGCYRDAGQEAKARELLVKAFDNPSVDISSKIIVIATYTDQLRHPEGKDQTALSDFTVGLYDHLSKTNPDNANVRIIGGDLFMALGKKEQALAAYLKATQLGATSFEAWQNIMVLESELNQLDSLIKHSEEGLEYFPNQAILYYFNGYANLRAKHFKESASSLEQARKLAVSNPELVEEVNGMLGDVYNGLKEYEKSDQAYDAALAANPNNDFVLNNYSYYLALRKQNLEKAEKMSALLIKNNPDNPTYLDTYAWVLFAREKYKEARKIIEKAIQSGDLNSAYFEHYGDILFKLGHVDEAVKQWEKAKSLDQDNEIINKKIANRKLY